MFPKIGLSRDHNPVQDVHYLLNFMVNFRKEFFKYKKGIVDFINKLLPKSLNGENGSDNSPLVKYRLSNYYVGSSDDCNFVPEKGVMMTPAEALIVSDIFDEFTDKAKNKKVLNSYNSKITENELEQLRKRSDMFIQ